MPRPRRRLPAATFWFWLGLGTLVALRALTYTRADGVRYFGVAPLREGPCRVVQVMSGDELVIVQDEDRGPVPLRLLSTHAPLLDRDSAELVADARRFTEAFVSHGDVRLVLDIHRLDERGRYLAYVECDGQQLNEALLLAGLARFESSPGNSASMERRLRDAEDAARTARIGIWK